MNNTIKYWETLGTELENILILKNKYTLKFQEEIWMLKTDYDGDGDLGLCIENDFGDIEQTKIVYHLYKNDKKIEDVIIKFQIEPEIEQINWVILINNKFIECDYINFRDREFDEFGIYDLMNIIKLCNPKLDKTNKSQYITFRYENRINGF